MQLRDLGCGDGVDKLDDEVGQFKALFRKFGKEFSSSG